MKISQKIGLFFTLGERKKWAALFNHERERKIFQTGERERERGFSGWARAHRFLMSALKLWLWPGRFILIAASCKFWISSNIIIKQLLYATIMIITQFLPCNIGWLKICTKSSLDCLLTHTMSNKKTHLADSKTCR